jgi:septum site-determining protein MinC
MDETKTGINQEIDLETEKIEPSASVMSKIRPNPSKK